MRQQEIYLNLLIKILGVILDQELRFKDHVGRITKRGIKAVQALVRLNRLAAKTARQLYSTLAVSIIIYASSI
jgi:hypothetical protein